MRAGSATALAHVKQHLVEEYKKLPTHADIAALGDQFLWLSDTLVSSPKLAEALTSTIRSDADKKRLIETAFGSHQAAITATTADAPKSDALNSDGLKSDASNSDGLNPVVINALADLSKQSWSQAADIADACEELGLFTILHAAKDSDELPNVQEELFSIDRALRTSRRLRAALSTKSRSHADRLRLADDIFSSSVSQRTMVLLHRVITRTSSGRLLAALRQLRILTAQAQDKELAVVETAVELSDEQKTRLRQILEAKSGHPVHIDSEIDSKVIGGMRIRQGADLYEGTLAASLQQARTRLAG